jgi:multidrug resistance efflux pump
VTLAAEASAKRPRSADLAGAGKRALSWRRFAKLIFGAVLLAAAVLTFYQQLVFRVSRDAVINARLAVIRAPIDGVATAVVTTPSSAIKAGEAVGRVEDALADDARLAQLQREVSATAFERDSLARRVTVSAR